MRGTQPFKTYGRASARHLKIPNLRARACAYVPDAPGPPAPLLRSTCRPSIGYRISHDPRFSRNFDPIPPSCGFKSTSTTPPPGLDCTCWCCTAHPRAGPGPRPRPRNISRNLRIICADLHGAMHTACFPTECLPVDETPVDEVPGLGQPSETTRPGARPRPRPRAKREAQARACGSGGPCLLNNY